MFGVLLVLNQHVQIPFTFGRCMKDFGVFTLSLYKTRYSEEWSYLLNLYSVFVSGILLSFVTIFSHFFLHFLSIFGKFKVWIGIFCISLVFLLIFEHFVHVLSIFARNNFTSLKQILLFSMQRLFGRLLQIFGSKKVFFQVFTLFYLVFHFFNTCSKLL